MKKVAELLQRPLLSMNAIENYSKIGRGERTQTFDLSVPNRARYQLRHTPIGVVPE